MTDLEKKFQAAARDVRQLPERPNNETLLKLYSLYKQGTEGDVSGKRPGFVDLKNRAKFDAWAELKGKSRQDAMREYVELVESLRQ